MPKDKKVDSGPRQRPISCRFCRQRKLRCSREVPCSNCVSRKIQCELEYPITVSSKNSQHSDTELVERIRKLEKLLETQALQQVEPLKQNVAVFDPAQNGRSALSIVQTGPFDKDVAFLESVYSDVLRSDKIPSTKLIFKICPMEKFKEAPSFINQSATGFDPARCIWLPTHSEAKVLLEKYNEDVDHLHHVCHAPSLPAMIDDIYAALNEQRQVQTSYLLLLLSICAACSHAWVRRDCARGVFSCYIQANSQTRLWIKAFEDVLDVVHRTGSMSIEAIQGIIVACFLIANWEGLSRRCRSLYSTALMLGRELKLHLLDHPANAHLANTVQTEIGRKIWWYIVATDWCIGARFRSAAQGVYQCHPRHMIVKKPLNIDDEDLVDGNLLGKPMEQPTDMSYCLMRLRLAEISRNIVDRTMVMITPLEGLSANVVLDIDNDDWNKPKLTTFLTRLQALLDSVPPFFSMSVPKLMETFQLSPLKARKIFHQGYIMRSMLYGQRCKLHFPFFGRAFEDTTYASSREACLESAYLIIETELLLEQSEVCEGTWYRFLGLLLGVFTASIVLLTDLCYNKASTQQEKQRGVIADAIRILEDARHQSEIAAKFLDSLMQVLRKHNVVPPKRAQSVQAAPHPKPLTAPLNESFARFVQPTRNLMGSAFPMSTCDNDVMCENNDFNGFGQAGEDLSSYFNELAQTFEQGIDPGSFDWNSMLLGFDSSFI